MKQNYLNVNKNNFTKIVKRADIYKLAIEKFKLQNQSTNAINYLSDMLFLSHEKLYMVLEGRRDFSIKEEENFLELTNFKSEFADLLKKYLIHKNKGEVK